MKEDIIEQIVDDCVLLTPKFIRVIIDRIAVDVIRRGRF